MADRLYLSCWLANYNGRSALRRWGKALEIFPASRLSERQSMHRVIPLNPGEAPLLEQALPSRFDPASVIEASREFEHDDCCYELETWWDLWQYDGDWNVAPVHVTLLCFGPEFENEIGDHLRIEFGLEDQFLPSPDMPASAHMSQSNLRSLLRLVHDMDTHLGIEKRRLWTESGENFADRLELALADIE